MKHLLFSIFIFIFSVLSVFSQSPALVTDRPDQTESSRTVPENSLQIETGIFWEQSIENQLQTDNFGLNTTLFRYGLLKRFELRFGYEYLQQRIIEDGGGNSENNGFQPFTLGTKIFICEQKGLLPEMALLTHFNLPRSGAVEYQTPYLGHDIILAASHQLNETLALGYNLGVEWDGKNPQPGGKYAMVAGIAITDKFGAFIETYGTFAKNKDFNNRIDTGFTFLILDNLQLDAAGGIGLTEISPDYFVAMGISWRGYFLNNKS